MCATCALLAASRAACLPALRCACGAPACLHHALPSQPTAPPNQLPHTHPLQIHRWISEARNRPALPPLLHSAAYMAARSSEA